MASIFASTAEVQMLVGADASATSNVVGHIDVYMAMAESYINAATGVNWSDTYTTLNADKREILKMAAASYAATMVINYDLKTFPSTLQVQTRLDVLDSWFVKALKVLTSEGVKESVAAA